MPACQAQPAASIWLSDGRYACLGTCPEECSPDSGPHVCKRVRVSEACGWERVSVIRLCGTPALGQHRGQLARVFLCVLSWSKAAAVQLPWNRGKVQRRACRARLPAPAVACKGRFRRGGGPVHAAAAAATAVQPWHTLPLTQCRQPSGALLQQLHRTVPWGPPSPQPRPPLLHPRG